MARLPLFQEIQRAMRIASWAERKQIRSAEAFERTEAARWNRRQFLKTAVAVAAGASVTPIFRAVAKGPQAPVVVIIGAGTAGLTCAYRLQQRGIAARVFGELSDLKVRMISQGASEINLTFVVEEEEVPGVVRRLHSTFFAELDAEVFA